MHAYHLVARHGEHAEWIVVAEVSFECERKVREVVERLHTVRRDTRRVERFAKIWNLGVGALQRLLQSIELQRRELGARHAFGAAIEHEWRRSIADCSLRRHDLISLSAASWQNPSRFDRRPGNARAARRCVVKREALIVSGPRDENELERPTGREGGQPAASECKRSSRFDNDSERDACERKNQAKGKEPGSIGVQHRNAANWRAGMPQRIRVAGPGQAAAGNQQEERSRNRNRGRRDSYP